MGKAMNARLAIMICTALASSYAQASDVVQLDKVTVLGEAVKAFDRNTTAGSKLGLTVKETPASVEVIDAKTMQQRGDSTIIRAVTKAAGITGGSSGHGTAGNYSVRGFTGYPGIDFLQDGIRLNGTIFSKRTLDVSNLDRIEIIKGASAVLNGGGSVGATVNLVTKKPSFGEEQTELGFKVGSHDSYRLNFGRAGVAVEDALAYRVDGVARHAGSDYHGEERELDSLSASLLYKVNDSLLSSLSLESTKDSGEQDYQGTPLINRRLDRSVRRINYNNLEDGVDAGDSLWLRNNTDWYPTKSLELKNQLYYQNASSDVRRLYLAVQDAANPGMINRRGYDSSQKQRLIGNRLDLVGRGDVFGLGNRFLVGVDASKLELNREQSTYAGRIIPTPMYSPARLYYRDFFNPTVDDYKKPDVDIKLNQIAFYIEDQLSLTEDLKLVAGLRHDSYDITYDFEQGLSSPVSQIINKKHNKLSYRGGLVFDITDTATVYASYSSSFEPGDASASFITVNAAQTKLDLTKAEQREIGWRQSFLSDKAEFSASAYHISKKNMLVSNPTPGAGLLSVGKQTAKGFEVALAVRPTEQLHIDANLSYVDSKYDDFVHNGVDYSGRSPSSIPRHVANLGIRYAPTSSLNVGTWVRYVDSFSTDNIGFANSVRLPSYTVVDLTINYTYRKNTTFSLLLKNMTDELYATTARRDLQVFLGEARGFEFGINYGF